MSHLKNMNIMYIDKNLISPKIHKNFLKTKDKFKIKRLSIERLFYLAWPLQNPSQIA